MHSYASYRLSETNDDTLVASELGNTAVMIHAHYKALTNAKAAAKWFDVQPPQKLPKGKVVRFPKSA